MVGMVDEWFLENWHAYKKYNSAMSFRKYPRNYERQQKWEGHDEHFKKYISEDWNIIASDTPQMWGTHYKVNYKQKVKKC